MLTLEGSSICIDQFPGEATHSSSNRTHHPGLGHSVRSGFITSAAEHGLRIDQIQQVSGHKNIRVLMGYIRSVDAWRDTPAAAIGL